MRFVSILMPTITPSSPSCGAVAPNLKPTHEGKSMKSMFRFLTSGNASICLLAVVALLLSFPNSVLAQAPPVPSTFQDLYTELDNYLINFNATLTANGPIAPFPVLLTGSLKAADGNVGPQLISGQPGMLLQLQALKAMGAQAIMVQVGFPILWSPFLTSQGQSYTAFANYYQGVAAAVRAAGL